ncbi:MAG: hypothetical protein QOK37_2996 [Thermoanaerobaculia bacterium]|nr:hypothetical protein [Thermoanaerobaculia bacterium]
MKTTLLLRIAAVLAVLFALGHTMGGPWTPTEERSAASVVDAMKSVRFDVAGSSRSYWDFYYGFGVSISVYLFAQAILLWLLATLAKTQAAAARPFVVVLLASYAANVFVTWRYFFVVPLVLSIAIVICLTLALVASRRHVDIEPSAHLT